MPTSIKPRDQMSFDEIVEDIFVSLQPGDMAVLRAIKTPDQLIAFHHSAGMHIRNLYGLWNKDRFGKLDLDLDLASADPIKTNLIVEHPDDTSQRVIEAVWQRLQDGEGQA